MLVSDVSDDQVVTLLYCSTDDDNTAGVLLVCDSGTDDEAETLLAFVELTVAVRLVVFEDPFTVVI